MHSSYAYSLRLVRLPRSTEWLLVMSSSVESHTPIIVTLSCPVNVNMNVWASDHTLTKTSADSQRGGVVGSGNSSEQKSAATTVAAQR